MIRKEGLFFTLLSLVIHVLSKESTSNYSCGHGYLVVVRGPSTPPPATAAAPVTKQPTIAPPPKKTPTASIERDNPFLARLFRKPEAKNKTVTRNHTNRTHLRAHMIDGYKEYTDMPDPGNSTYNTPKYVPGYVYDMALKRPRLPQPKKLVQHTDEDTKSSYVKLDFRDRPAATSPLLNKEDQSNLQKAVNMIMEDVWNMVHNQLKQVRRVLGSVTTRHVVTALRQLLSDTDSSEED